MYAILPAQLQGLGEWVPDRICFIVKQSRQLSSESSSMYRTSMKCRRTCLSPHRLR